MQLSEGRLTKSVCDETHMFKPFSSGDHGATTSQQQTIEFVSATANNQVAPSRGFHFISNLKKKKNFFYAGCHLEIVEMTFVYPEMAIT